MTIDADLERLLARGRETAGPALKDMDFDDARAMMRDMFLANGYPVQHPANVRQMSAQECLARLTSIFTALKPPQVPYLPSFIFMAADMSWAMLRPMTPIRAHWPTC